MQILARQDAFQNASQRGAKRPAKGVERAAREIVRDATRSIGWWDRVRAAGAGWLNRIRATTAGRITLKVTVAVLGVAIILLGLLMIPLPGPGWLVVFFGLAILSIEYVWAKHLLRYTRQKVKAWTRWVGRQPWWLRGVVGALGLVVLAGLLWVVVGNGYGGEFVQSTWRFLTSQ